jgi:hypothetical protein
MLRFEWNALRVGDMVLVHDPAGRFPAASGTVVTVDTKRERRGANGVGIRVGAEGRHEVVWPSFLAVHHDPADLMDDCWRCAALTEAAPRPRAVPHLRLVGAPG